LNSERYIVNVEAAVVDRGRYLLAVRGMGEGHAAGAVSPIGGKVEGPEVSDDVLEETLRREVEEEVGLRIRGRMEYVESKAFTTDDGERVVDVVFLCRHEGGGPRVVEPEEVSSLTWMTKEVVLAGEEVPAWTRRSISLAQQKRRALGW
jgi:8-oxo-dGTP diphosphatase